MFQFRQSRLLLVREIPGILQPEIAGLRHQFLMRLPLIADLVPADLVHRFGEVLNDMKLVEHQNRVGRLGLDDIDVRLPHVATDAFDLFRALLTQPFEEILQRLLGATLAAPQQSAVLEIVNVGDRKSVV